VEGGITGDELIAFINQEQAILPDGSAGAPVCSPICAAFREPTAATAAM